MFHGILQVATQCTLRVSSYHSHPSFHFCFMTTTRVSLLLPTFFKILSYFPHFVSISCLYRGKKRKIFRPTGRYFGHQLETIFFKVGPIYTTVHVYKNASPWIYTTIWDTLISSKLYACLYEFLQKAIFKKLLLTISLT